MPSAPVNYQRTREMTIDELLLENRIVFLVGRDQPPEREPGDDADALPGEPASQSGDQPLHQLARGVVDDTLALYDTMRFLSSPVATYCIGRAYSGGAVLLTAGTKGRRFILPHAKVMIHQPSGGMTGQTEDIKLQAEQIIKSKNLLIEIIARHTGQDPEKVRTDSERDKFFDAEEAKAYGLIDEVLTEPPRTPSRRRARERDLERRATHTSPTQENHA